MSVYQWWLPDSRLHYMCEGSHILKYIFAPKVGSSLICHNDLPWFRHPTCGTVQRHTTWWYMILKIGKIQTYLWMKWITSCTYCFSVHRGKPFMKIIFCGWMGVTRLCTVHFQPNIANNVPDGLRYIRQNLTTGYHAMSCRVWVKPLIWTNGIQNGPQCIVMSWAPVKLA